jgi:uncharacterized protein YhjY with autotransporter beta-barrel domain
MVRKLGATGMVVSDQFNEERTTYMTQQAEKYYRLLIRVSSGLQSPFLLAVRLYSGWQFVQTGWASLAT